MNTIIATSALAATATPVSLDALAAQATDDPAYAAIEAHRLAFVETERLLTVRGRWERAVWRKKIKDDDPRWIAADSAANQALADLVDAENSIVLTQPATIAGVVAIVRYLSGETGENIFESAYGFERYDGEVLSWRDALHDQLAAALERIAAGSPSTPGSPRLRLIGKDYECADEGLADDDGTDADPADEMTESEKLQKNLATWQRVQALCTDEIKSIEEQLQAIAA